MQPKVSEVFETYWKFAAERQNIFFNKIKGVQTITKDKVLQDYKFTNAYRASDRVSQYLIREVIYSGDYKSSDIFFRIILFKLFNKIETWKYLEETVGPITWENYSYERMDIAFKELIDLKSTIYSGAYIMASGKSYFGYKKKYQNHLKLLELMMKDGLPEKIKDAKSLEEVYSLLKMYPTLGKFLAFQFTIDLNYSELINFSEMDFVVAGPGAKDGINKCFTNKGDYTDEDIIQWVTENQVKEFNKLGIEFKNLWGRELQLIDCQNLFCEVDKYARVMHPNINGSSTRHRIKQKYKPQNERIPNYIYPPKWEINNKVFQYE